MIEVTVQVSEENEITDAPYWLIIDPEQMMKPSVDHVAHMITGLFFSRKEAEEHLEARRHAFSSKAVVYCHSGHAANQWREAWHTAVYAKRATTTPHLP